MPTTDINVATFDGYEMPAFLAWPEGHQRWPTAVVLGELFGLTDVQRDATERVAAMGYVAIAPDLLHRRAPGGPLPEDEDGRRQGLALIDELTRLELRACVAMYAGWLAGTAIAASRPEPTGRLALAGRLLILVGEADPMVPASDIATLRAWQPEAQVITYPRVGHRFCSIGRPGYDPEAAADAWTQAAQFLT